MVVEYNKCDAAQQNFKLKLNFNSQCMKVWKIQFLPNQSLRSLWRKKSRANRIKFREQDTRTIDCLECDEIIPVILDFLLKLFC